MALGHDSHVALDLDVALDVGHDLAERDHPPLYASGWVSSQQLSCITLRIAAAGNVANSST